jgi:hypothetical protein
MTKPMKNLVVRLRCEPEFKQKIVNAINEGKAKSLSGLIRTAVDKFLEPEKNDHS